ncbi:collagen-binding domain-containing protein, partial [Polaribacter dokdonensis]
TASITEGQTKTLTGAPNGGTWSIVSGGGTINGTTYTPVDINTNTTVVIRYTIAADGDCAATTDDVTFTVTPVCDVVADNTTSTASITEGQTKTLTGTPNGGTWSIVSGGGTINGTTYTPADINTNTTVVIRYTIAADGDCAATSDDVTFTVTPVCDVVADNTTSTASITEGQTKTLTGTPNGGTWSIVSGGGTINGTTYTPADINTNTTVVIRYTIPADGDCAATTDDVAFTVTPICNDPINSVTSNLNTTENTQLNLNNTSVSGDDLVTVRLRVNNGTLNVIVRVSGTRNDVRVNGPGDLLITGNVRTINSYLSTLTYTPNTGFYGTDIFTIDSGNSCGTIITNNYNITVNQNCEIADNTTSDADITEGQTKTLTGTPAGGTWSIVSGGGSINGSTYAPDDINTNTIVVIRYTIAADDTCSSTSDDVTFTVTPVCDVIADNATSDATINEGEAKTLVGSPAGGTWAIISGGGSINGNTYSPDDINTNTTVVIRYTIAADGDCAATTDDVTFTVTPVCDVVADNTTTATTINEGQTKTLTGNPTGGTFSVVSGGGTINGNIYTPADVSTDTTVIIRYTIAASGSCAASTSDVTFTVTEGSCTQTPTEAALGFNVFTLEGLQLSTNETEGSVATGGDLTLSGNYQITTNDPGSFQVNNVPVGLVVGGKVNYQSGNSLQINQNTYVKIGNSNGSTVWYKDQNNAFSPIRITKNSSYNSSPRINLQANANQLNVSSTNNPVFESNVIDFASAFQTLRGNSTNLSQYANNAQLTNPNGQPISNTNLPNQVKINLQAGVNYLNVTGSDLNNVSVFTYNNKPSATNILVINVDAAGSFDWSVWNQAGVGQQDAPYIIYNFYNTTTLNVVGNSTVVGSLFAPFADINKTVNQSNIEGQVIAKSFNHSGGEVHSANFLPAISGCTTSTGIAPTAEFNVNNNNQCFDGNSFEFTNTSNTGNVSQPNDPITYAWDFGDGTSSTLMSPTKSYANSGTYTVTMTATNSVGSDSTTTQVIVKQDLDITLTTSSVSNGDGSVTKTFSIDNPANFQSYDWSLLASDGSLVANIGTNVTTATATVSDAGLYYVEIIAEDINGCTKTHRFSVTVTSGEVTGGNSGGVESESLGDAISKIYVGRKKNSVPTTFVKSDANLYNKAKMKAEQPYQGKGQTMLDMFPTELVAGNVANVTSPTDILDYTVADEVLSVDFSLDGKTKGVVLGVKTSDKIYNHTKASCDRLRGAEILNIQTVQLEGYNFLMQGIKQRNGVVEYAISFATAKNNNDTNYTIQTNWYVNNYIKFNDVYNFQVWTTNPADTQKLVVDILNNLKAFIPVTQTEVQKVPKTYAAKISREKNELVVLLRSTQKGLNTEISMEEIYSETANNVKFRYNPVNTELEQTLRVDIADGYEYDGLVKVDGEVEDAFYHADGNWGLDFDASYTKIKDYFVSNSFDRTYQDDEHAINRNVALRATSDFDYLTLYKSLLPGTLAADYSEYNYLSFTAKGSGLIELGLIKKSIEDWKAQYRVMVDLSEEEQTYYVPFDIFTSSASQENLTAEDLTTLLFTFLPVEAQTKELDLTISDVKFTKIAVEDQIVNKIEKFENEFMAYPNPSQGNVNLLLFSQVDTEATVTLTDITGKTIYKENVNLNTGKNELDFNFRVKTGVMLLKVASKETNYGTSKIIFR